MANNYFIEYNNYINDLQQELMQIQFRYNECIENVKIAKNIGELSIEEAEILLSQRMDTYYEQFDSRYRLSKTDVEFIRTYAALDKNGILLASFLKSEYFEKKDKLTSLLEAIRVYAFLDSLSPDEAKLTVKTAMRIHYSEELKKIDIKMNNLISMYGEKGKGSRKYLELDRQRSQLLKVLKFIADLQNVSEEIYDKLIEQFYNVDKKYYEWFLKMQIKQEYEDGVVYQEHVNTLNSVQESSVDLVNSSEELIKTNKELEETKKELFNVLIGISQIDIDTAVDSVRKTKRKLFKKDELSNIEVLFNMFIELFSISDLKNYIDYLYGNVYGEMDLKSIFDVYFSTKYGKDTLYVDFYKFINDFRNDVLQYYRIKIEGIINRVNALNVKINSNTTLMCDNIKVSMNQALLQKDIREQYPAKKDDLIIVGFTMDELNRIYANLKEFIRNGFSFGADDEELFLRKV